MSTERAATLLMRDTCLLAETLAEQPLDLVKAAKVVIALSGWTKTPNGDEVYQSSYMAVEVLRKAIEQHENPVLSLAPEPLPRGL